jgi:hypothetical protein
MLQQVVQLAHSAPVTDTIATLKAPLGGKYADSLEVVKVLGAILSPVIASLAYKVSLGVHSIVNSRTDEQNKKIDNLAAINVQMADLLSAVPSDQIVLAQSSLRDRVRSMRAVPVPTVPAPAVPPLDGAV